MHMSGLIQRNQEYFSLLAVQCVSSHDFLQNCIFFYPTVIKFCLLILLIILHQTDLISGRQMGGSSHGGLCVGNISAFVWRS